MFGISGVVIVFMASDKQSFDKLKIFPQNHVIVMLNILAFVIWSVRIYMLSPYLIQDTILCAMEIRVSHSLRRKQTKYIYRKKANMKQVTPKYQMGGEELGEEMPRLQHPAFGSWIPLLPLISCVIQSKLFNLFMPLYPNL